MSIKEAWVVDYVKSRCVMRSERLLVAFQRPLIHRLRLLQPFLSPVEDAQVVNRVKIGVAAARLVLASARGQELKG